MRGRSITVSLFEGFDDDGSEVRALLVVERKLPAPPRVPDVAADVAAAIEVRDAHERRGFGGPVRAGSTLRLVPPSRRAA